MKMKYFLPLLLLIIFSVSTVSADISWTGNNWLFCYNQSLIQYNGTNFTDITPNTVTIVTSAGEQKIKASKYFQYDWSVGPCGVWFKHRILSMGGIASAGIFNYKDRNFTVWTTGLGVVHGIACNSKFCIINVDFKPGPQMVYPILLKYNSNSNFTFTDITNQLGASVIRGTIRARNIKEMNLSAIYGDISGVNLSAVSDAIHRWIWTNGSKSPDKENITTGAQFTLGDVFGSSSPLACNGKYCLILVSGSGYIWIKSNNAYMETSSVNVNALTEYNGSSFKNLRLISPNFTITSSIGWNGKYWLIGGEDYYGEGVVKYRGHVISKSPPHVKYEILFLDSGLNTVKEIRIPLKPYYIYPLGRILLVTGVKKVKSPNSYNSYKNSYSYSYNLTTLLVNPDNKNVSRFNVTVLDAGFNGTTGLIVGKDSQGNLRIIKYNGKNFIDLTPQLKAALQPSSVKTHKFYPVAEKQTNATHASVMSYYFGWNGNYWLISGDVLYASNATDYYRLRLVRYDGSNFTPVRQGAHIAISSWNGRYWLLGGINTLLKYDGKKITNLSGELHNLIGHSFRISTIKWSNGYWFINLWRININSHGHIIPGESIYETVIYDNSSEFKMVGIKPTPYETHSSFNGKYWLIGGNYGTLFRYNGRKLVDLSREIMDEIPHNLPSIKHYPKLVINGTSPFTTIYPIAINSTDWLIKIDGAFKDPKNLVYGEKVLDYNGKNFADLTEEMHDGKNGFFGTKDSNEQGISGIKWNPYGEYWLIAGDYGILRKYSHGNFTIVGNMSSLYSMSGEIFGITDMVYNPSDKYWLILGYKSPDHPYTPYGLIMKFNGTKLWDITPYNIFNRMFVTGRMEFFMDGAKWNGKYWLISGGGRLVKYNGTSFEDLTPEFLGALSAISQTVKASQGVKNQTIVKPKKPQKNYNNLILVIVAVLLFVSVIYSIVKRNKSQ